MHNGYINIDNEKMSKSLGNFVLVHDIIKNHDPQVFRFFMLSVHYRHPINYSEELLENTKAGIGTIKTSYQNLKHRSEASTNLTDNNEDWLKKINRFTECTLYKKWMMILIQQMRFLCCLNFLNKLIII